MNSLLASYAELIYHSKHKKDWVVPNVIRSRVLLSQKKKNKANQLEDQENR